MDEIVNRVAKSPLITLDFEEFYPEGKRQELDISQWLYEGLILKEKEFRTALTKHNWEQYKGTYVTLNCSSDAILPAWAMLLVASYLEPVTKLVSVGSLQDLELVIFTKLVSELDVDYLKNKPVIIKGCSNKQIPEAAFVLLTQKIQKVAKLLMFGEACSTVPIYKKSKRLN